MTLLLTNDDGVFAPALVGTLEALSMESSVRTMFPSSQRSASSMAMTLHKPLRVWTVERKHHALQVSNGTPVDCVLLAKNLYKDELVGVVSGVNDGPNLGLDIHYSGTVAAARKAALLGLPGVAVSSGELLSLSNKIHSESTEIIVRSVAKLIRSHPIPTGVYLNINVPNLPVAELKGARLTRPGNRRYRDMMNIRTDPTGRDYFWVNGIEIFPDETDGSDSYAISQGFVSITPLSVRVDHPNPDWDCSEWAEGIEASIISLAHE
ncbi:5'/3'-nucleotidase SurE [bacterium]|nr:5'/3'-nucleotidase SurE [bacterium]